MTLGTLLLILLVLILIGALPSWGYSRNWGYAPSGITGLLVVILLIMVLTGRYSYLIVRYLEPTTAPLTRPMPWLCCREIGLLLWKKRNGQKADRRQENLF